MDRDAYHKFHDFSGWLGWSLVVFKLLLFGVYWYFYSFTRKEVKKNQAFFYDTIVGIGAIFLLSDPLLIIAMHLLPEWQRSFYFYILDNLLHTLLQAYLLLQLGSKSSSFTKSINEATGLPVDGGAAAGGKGL